jgi:hypothetical protein
VSDRQADRRTARQMASRPWWRAVTRQYRHRAWAYTPTHFRLRRLRLNSIKVATPVQNRNKEKQKQGKKTKARTHPEGLAVAADGRPQARCHAARDGGHVVAPVLLACRHERAQVRLAPLHAEVQRRSSPGRRESGGGGGSGVGRWRLGVGSRESVVESAGVESSRVPTGVKGKRRETTHTHTLERSKHGGVQGTPCAPRWATQGTVNDTRQAIAPPPQPSK